MSEPRPPFSARVGAREHDLGPFEGVPEHLVGPLQRWVAGQVRNDEERSRRISLSLRLPSPVGPWDALIASTGWQLLDVVDAILSDPDYQQSRRDGCDDGWDPDYEMWFGSAEVTHILDVGGSLYRVNEAGDGLEERVTPAVRDAVQRTVSAAVSAPSAGSAADHLAAAWQAAYGRAPDPSRAYSEAIKAVESAAHSVVEPNNQRATQGSMVKVFSHSHHKFAFVLPGTKEMTPVAMVEEMWRMLNNGQTSRHGGQEPTVEETLESARAAAHLAATLVQWFVSGAIQRLH